MLRTALPAYTNCGTTRQPDRLMGWRLQTECCKYKHSGLHLKFANLLMHYCVPLRTTLFTTPNAPLLMVSFCSYSACSECHLLWGKVMQKRKTRSNHIKTRQKIIAVLVGCASVILWTCHCMMKTQSIAKKLYWNGLQHYWARRQSKARRSFLLTVCKVDTTGPTKLNFVIRVGDAQEFEPAADFWTHPLESQMRECQPDRENWC